MKSTAPIERRFDYSAQVRIHYEVHGRGAKPALLLHGFGASLEMWRDIQPYLEPHLLLHLADMKGFGLSSKPDDGRYSIEHQAAVMASFIEELDLKGLCLIGHSYGGAVSLATYLKLAQRKSAGRVKSLVLIASPATVQSLPFFVWPLRTPVLNLLARLAPSRSRARFVLSHICYDPRMATEERVDRYARFHDLPGSHHALIAAAEQIVPENPDAVLARLAAIAVPTLIIWGQHDRVIYRWQADLLKERIPDSKLVVIPRCGHIPHEECPEQTARQILNFLAA
jgi:pimeloyl-ACP methyl ester carboxylesterase